MQRFELIEGTAAKFWEVQAEGNALTVRFGRIGTQGQTKTKTFASESAAQAEQAKLIREKTGKGYANVAVTTSMPVNAPGAAPAEPPSTAAEPTPAAASTEAASTAAPTLSAADLPWPSGGLDESLLPSGVQMPKVRGIHAPPLEIPADLFDHPPRLVAGPFFNLASQFEAMAATCGETWHRWGDAAARFLTAEALAAADRAGWLQACAQCLMASNWTHDGSPRWIVLAGVQLRGVAFMVDVLMTLQRAIDPVVGSLGVSLGVLRHAIAVAPPPEHDAAVAEAERQRRLAPTSMFVASYLFPHHTAWFSEAMGQIRHRADMDWLDSCAISADQALAFVRHMKHLRQPTPNLRLHAALHGEALLPVLSALIDQTDPDWASPLFNWVLALRYPAQIGTLVAHFDHGKEARARLDKVAEAFPAATLYTAIGPALRAPASALKGWALRLGARHPDAQAQALAVLPPAQASAWRQMLERRAPPEAPAEALPELLRAPPWTGKPRAAELPTLHQPQLAVSPRVHVPERVRQYAARSTGSHASGPKGIEHTVLEHLRIRAESRQAIIDGKPLEPADIDPAAQGWRLVRHLLPLPEPLAIRLWNDYPADDWSNDDPNTVRVLLARHGVAALPGLLNYARVLPESGLSIGIDVDDAGLAELALQSQHKAKAVRAAAQAWMQQHPRTTAAVALHHAFGPDAKSREAGATALRWLVRQGHEPLIDQVAGEYAAAMPAAWQALKALDPLAVLPPKLPALPPFFAPITLIRPVLQNGAGALPVSAVEHIGTMLSISTLEAPYPGLDQVRAACTAESLAAFAWEVFEAWESAGASPRQAWAFHALGWLGNDDTVRQLAPKVRTWPAESATKKRAEVGMELLALIGTDLALMHLNAMADKLKFTGLRDKAREKMAAIAEARGFSTEQLADRLVPDLGLDDRGAEVLDFGPRQFTVAFDEALLPYVRGAAGVRLKTLPRANKDDDAERASAASARFKQLKKDAEAIASAQIARLERAMAQQRRWPAADFKRFFLLHPVTRFLAARLVWGVYEDGVFTEGFRIAEDWTLADVRDDAYGLSDAATVGIAHVLDMPADVRNAFGQILSDYEIAQPFAQMARETYALTEAELAANTVTRFAQRPVKSGSIMGLIHRGWERGEAFEAGTVLEFVKAVPGTDCRIVASLDPGLALGYMQAEPKQTVTAIVLRSISDDTPQPLHTLNAVAASEMLRDIDLMTPFA